MMEIYSPILPFSTIGGKLHITDDLDIRVLRRGDVEDVLSEVGLLRNIRLPRECEMDEDLGPILLEFPPYMTWRNNCNLRGYEPVGFSPDLMDIIMRESHACNLLTCDIIQSLRTMTGRRDALDFLSGIGTPTSMWFYKALKHSGLSRTFLYIDLNLDTDFWRNLFGLPREMQRVVLSYCWTDLSGPVLMLVYHMFDTFPIFSVGFEGCCSSSRPGDPIWASFWKSGLALLNDSIPYNNLNPRGLALGYEALLGELVLGKSTSSRRVAYEPR